MITVLIADDHKIFTEGLCALLEKEKDIQVDGVAHNGQQAIALIRDHPVDVAVLDIDMPGMNGIEAARAILSLTVNTQIIVLSAYDKPEYVRQMKRVGVKGYILKNQGLEELAAGIRAVHNGQNYWGSGITQKVMEAFFSDGQESKAPSISPKQMEVLRLICSCGTTAEIAHLLKLKESTVQTHIRHLLAKLNLRNKQALAMYAMQNGICGKGQ
jgi:DNA-binding NarL/FixJ family response regulator